MSHKYNWPDGEWVVPSPTGIIGACTSKFLHQWSANEVVNWIEANCEVREPELLSEDYLYYVTEADLDTARVHYKTVSEEALSVGSEVHDMCENYFKDFQSTKNRRIEVVNSYNAFLQFVGDYNVTHTALEETVYGEVDGRRWAGTLDFRGPIDGDEWILDYKTSKALYDANIQLAAYRSTFKEKFRYGALRLPKDGIPLKSGKLYEFKEYTSRYEKDLETWQYMVKQYFSSHPIIARKAGWEG